MVGNDELHKRSHPSKRSRKRFNKFYYSMIGSSRDWKRLRRAERASGRERDIREFSIITFDEWRVRSI